MTSGRQKLALVLVLLMSALQAFYGFYAYLNPEAFAVLRGTELFVQGDADWVQIYASRTLFIALFLAYLLYHQQFQMLMIAAFLGMVMPITDGWLAYQAQAPMLVVYKHVATVAYLLVTFFALKAVVRERHILGRSSALS